MLYKQTEAGLQRRKVAKILFSATCDLATLRPVLQEEGVSHRFKIMSKNYFYSIATIIGTIIGAGIFSLPFVTDKSGLLPFYVLLAVLTAIQCYINKMYAEIVLSTKTEHRIPGYIEIYRGKKYKKIVSVFSLLGGYGSILAYIILGGIFLHGLLGSSLGGTEFIYSLIVFAFSSFIVFFGIKAIASVELLMTVFLIAVVGFVTFKSSSFIDMSNFALVNWKYALLPYGLVFFAIGGQTAVPEICRLLKDEKRSIKSAIFWGTIIPSAITAIFVTVVVGVTGNQTSPDTLVGLSQVFSNGIVTFALIFGLISIITSFLTISQAIREVYWWDFEMNKTIAWVLAVFLPLIFFLLGVQNLTKVVGITGAISGGVMGAIIIYLSFLVQKKAQKRSIIKTGMNKWIGLGLSSLFIIGLIYSLIDLL